MSPTVNASHPSILPSERRHHRRHQRLEEQVQTCYHRPLHQPLPPASRTRHRSFRSPSVRLHLILKGQACLRHGTSHQINFICEDPNCGGRIPPRNPLPSLGDRPPQTDLDRQKIRRHPAVLHSSRPRASYLNGARQLLLGLLCFEFLRNASL